MEGQGTESGFHGRFAERGARFAAHGGFRLPRDFSGLGAAAEYRACRERAAVADLSALRKYEVLGPDAETLMQHCVTRDMRRLSAGQMTYTALCREDGGMIDDGLVFRLGDNHFRWVGNGDAAGQWIGAQAGQLGLYARVRPSGGQLHNIALQGPRSPEILAAFLWTPPARPAAAELDWMHFTVGRIRGFEGAAVVVSRSGCTGEPGYEIFCRPLDAGAVFDALWEAGKDLGLAPLGLEALELLRIEAGVVRAGREFDEHTDPFEAGIGFTVPLDSKAEAFVGRPALLRRRERPERRLVGLDLEGERLPAAGMAIHTAGAQVGCITSAARSPGLGKGIALARIQGSHAALGTDLEVGAGSERIPAVVVHMPHYDPGREHVRGVLSGSAGASRGAA